MKVFSTQLKTELRLSLRGMDMVIFCLALPVVVMIILGLVFGSKPAFEGSQYSFVQQSFGAVSLIGVCASGVMGLPIVIADYRHKKILKRYHTTPISPVINLMVQVAVSAMYSVASAFLVYLTAKLFFNYRMLGSPVLYFVMFILIMLTIFSLGMFIAGVSKNVKTANLLCVILYFPMLIFSGATLPYEVMPVSMQKIADILPLTQGIKIVKIASLGLLLEKISLPIAFMMLLAIVCIVTSIRFFKWE